MARQIISFIILGILFTSLGVAGTKAYEEFTSKKQLEGLWIPYAEDYDDALSTAKERDGYGDWVCINTEEMDYNRCVEVAQHECGHELWAEMCEKDNDICNQAQTILTQYGENN